MKFIIFAITLCIFTVTQVQSAPQVCNALILENAGDQGAYQAGAFKALANLLPAADRSYNQITGVSGGAVNAGGIGQFPLGQEIQAADYIIDKWLNIDQDDVYDTYLGGVVQGLLFEKSIYNTKAFETTVRNIIKKPFQRNITVGATDLNTAEYLTWDEKAPYETQIQAIIASGALPIVFPYQVIGDNILVDGSVVQTFDLASAVDECMQLTGGNETLINVDIIFTSTPELQPWNPNSGVKSIGSYTREQKIIDYINSMRNLYEDQQAYKINWRYLIEPSVALSDSNFPYQFDHDAIVKMINQGYNDAVKTIQAKYKSGEQPRLIRAYQEELKKAGIEPTDENVMKLKAQQKANREELAAMFVQ